MINTMKTSYSSMDDCEQAGFINSFDSEENSTIESDIEIQKEKVSSTFVKVLIASATVLFITIAIITFKSSGLSLSPLSASLDTTSIQVFGNLEDYQKEALFRLFAEEYGKEYKTDEYATRFEFFKDYLDIVDARNMLEDQAGGNAVHGITQFADLSPIEFNSYLGYVSAESTLSLGETVDDVDEYTGDKDEVDWTGVYTTDVKTQGYCASSWAFSAVSQIESDSIRTSILTTDDDISVQQFVSCDEDAAGCSGGDPMQAYEYAINAGGINLEKNYPYTSLTNDAGTCDTTKIDYAISVNKYYKITGDDATEIETNMINYVKSTGTLQVCLDATSLASYTSGVMAVCGTNGIYTINHCAQVVGVNTDEGYWKLRNSWGSSWGESGYFRLKVSADTCGITTAAVYTHVYQSGSDQVDVTSEDEEDEEDEDEDEEDEDEEDEDEEDEDEDEEEGNEEVPSFRSSSNKKFESK